MTAMVGVLVLVLLLYVCGNAPAVEPVYHPADGRMVFTVPGPLADGEPMVRFIEEDDTLLVPLPFMEPAPAVFFNDFDDEWITGYGIVERPVGFCWIFAKRDEAMDLKRYLAATTAGGRLVLTLMKPYRQAAVQPAPAVTAAPVSPAPAASEPARPQSAAPATSSPAEAKLSRLNALLAGDTPPAGGAPAATAATPPSLLGSGVRMASVLCGVLALFLLLVGPLKKGLARFGGGSGDPRGLVRVLRTVPLGMKRQIMFIEIAGEVLVVGASGDRLSLLTRIDDPAKVEELRLGAGASGTSARAGGFARTLRAAWRRSPSAVPEAPARPAGDVAREPRHDSSPPSEPAAPDADDLYGQVVDQIKQRLQDLPRL
ncbi:MAG: flagellar biosynthetic protein FliO [Deltaproteobacteria bacterium]|nr:flagellar biosynthetic protein FliO [Candidatus Anaeroferrophillacea bacterium]